MCCGVLWCIGLRDCVGLRFSLLRVTYDYVCGVIGGWNLGVLCDSVPTGVVLIASVLSGLNAFSFAGIVCVVLLFDFHLFTCLR